MAHGVDPAIGSDDTDAEEIRVHALQGWVDRRIPPARLRSEPRVGLCKCPIHGLGRRQPPRGHVRAVVGRVSQQVLHRRSLLSGAGRWAASRPAFDIVRGDTAGLGRFGAVTTGNQDLDPVGYRVDRGSHDEIPDPPHG